MFALVGVERFLVLVHLELDYGEVHGLPETGHVVDGAQLGGNSIGFLQPEKLPQYRREVSFEKDICINYI